MRLIKHFSKTKEDNWRKEAEIVKELRTGRGHPNILKYCWHCTSVYSKQIFVSPLYSETSQD